MIAWVEQQLARNVTIDQGILPKSHLLHHSTSDPWHKVCTTCRAGLQRRKAAKRESTSLEIRQVPYAQYGDCIRLDTEDCHLEANSLAGEDAVQYFEGLRYVSAQLERLILYIYPTMVALMSWAFLKDRITKRHLIALVLAYAGVAILFGAEIGHQGPNAWLGGGLIFAGAFIYAVYVTASKPVIKRLGPTMFTAFGMSIASIAFLTHSGIEMAFHTPPPVTANGYWLALTLAIVCTVIPSFMIAEAISRIGPGPMSAVGGIGPVVAAWAAVAILDEPFGWPHAVAMALTIAGVWLLAKPKLTRTAGARTW